MTEHDEFVPEPEGEPQDEPVVRDERPRCIGLRNSGGSDRLADLRVLAGDETIDMARDYCRTCLGWEIENDHDEKWTVTSLEMERERLESERLRELDTIVLADDEEQPF